MKILPVAVLCASEGSSEVLLKDRLNFTDFSVFGNEFGNEF